MVQRAAHRDHQPLLALARDRRADGQGQLPDVLAQLAGHAALLVRGAVDGVDRADAVETGRVALERGHAPLGHVEVRARRQLGVDEELALDQLGHQLAAQARVQAQARREQSEGQAHGQQRMGQHPVELALVDGGEPVEHGVEDLQR